MSLLSGQLGTDLAQEFRREAQLGRDQVLRHGLGGGRRISEKNPDTASVSSFMRVPEEYSFTYSIMC